MGRVSVKLTVYFEDPFWIGIFERSIDEKLSVCKVIFGAEPKDNEVLELVLNRYSKLKYSPEIQYEKVFKEKVNPKRVQRDVKKQLNNKGVGTKSQQALKLQQEQNKTIRRIKTKEQKELEKEKMYSLKQQKKREKHKGR
ncbi:MAG: YjdF family protein [Clostridia bacterium]